jgi:hypothetical protein
MNVKKVKTTKLPAGSKPSPTLPANVIEFPLGRVSYGDRYETEAQIIYVDFKNKRKVA